jgi:hypothetical protein
VFETRVQRRIFGSRKDEVTGEWRELRNEELQNLSSPTIIRMVKSKRMRWPWHVTWRGEKGTVYRTVVVKAEGKRPLGRPRCKRVDNIEIDFE